MDNHVSLVTLQQGKDHLQMDHDLSDADIQMKIESASSIVLDYLKLDQVPPEWGLDNGSDDEASGVEETGTAFTTGKVRLVQAAVLSILSELCKNRESSKMDVLPPAIENVLRRLRDPALA